MSFYSDGKVKSEIMDAVYYSENDRVEFRLDRGTIMNNLTIANLGLFDGVALNDGNKARYDFMVGTKAVIKNIHLYDGKVSLQSIHNVNRVAAANQRLKSNNVNGNIERFTNKHFLGYRLSAQSGQVAFRDVDSLNFDNDDSKIAVSDNKLNVNAGLVPVSELLPIVAKMSCLPSSIFSQLRLVIEFESDNRKLITNTTHAADLKTLKPVLLIDRVVDDATESSLIAKLDSFEFNTYEDTNINIPAVANGVRETVEQKTLAFNNKFVTRLRTQLKYANPALHRNAVRERHSGRLGDSFNVNLRGVQYRVNGAQLLPRGELVGDNRRLALYIDTYGDVNMTHKDAQSYANETVQQNGVVGIGNAASNSFNGCYDVDGIYVGKMIEELQITFSRTGTNDGSNPSRYNNQLILFIEAEIKKQIDFGAGGYKVGYVSV